jgi:hypothetical protein
MDEFDITPVKITTDDITGAKAMANIDGIEVWIDTAKPGG